MFLFNILGKFTQNTDVWSFGVTLWEIFSFAREAPFEELSDPQVIENACELIQNREFRYPYLEQPEYCPDDVYGLMRNCWQDDAEDRPTFVSLFRFFKQISNAVEMDI